MSPVVLKVITALKERGIETPLLPPEEQGEWTPHGRRGAIAEHVAGIMTALGLDLTNDSLANTPDRVARMMVGEMFAGLNYDNFPACTTIENTMYSTGEFVLETGIAVNSVCEHHLVTIDGMATVAYVPRRSVLGLSKINRIVNFFARRPQVQERLTHQIGTAIGAITDTPDVAVLIDAVHYCVKARGIRDASSRTVTFHGTGQFSGDTLVRREFMARAKS